MKTKQHLGIYKQLATIVTNCQILSHRHGFSYEEKTVTIRAKFSKKIIEGKLIDKCEDKEFAKQLCIKNNLSYE